MLLGQDKKAELLNERNFLTRANSIGEDGFQIEEIENTLDYINEQLLLQYTQD